MTQSKGQIERLFRQYHQQMLRMAVMLVHDEEEAKDIVHDVFGRLDARLRLKVWKPIEIELTANNLLGTSTFVTRQTTDMVEHYAEYHLRPRSFMASVRFNLGKK